MVEISPRLPPAHPKWNKHVFDQLVKNHEKVRVSGWLMWDQEHPEQVGKTRGTLWKKPPPWRVMTRVFKAPDPSTGRLTDDVLKAKLADEQTRREQHKLKFRRRK